MRAVVQRVTEGDVTVENQVTGSIGNGFVVLLGVEDTDTENTWLIRLSVFAYLKIQKIK